VPRMCLLAPCLSPAPIGSFTRHRGLRVGPPQSVVRLLLFYSSCSVVSTSHKTMTRTHAHTHAHTHTHTEASVPTSILITVLSVPTHGLHHAAPQRVWYTPLSAALHSIERALQDFPWYKTVGILLTVKTLTLDLL
jgi:hypothetical protein